MAQVEAAQGTEAGGGFELPDLGGMGRLSSTTTDVPWRSDPLGGVGVGMQP